MYKIVKLHLHIAPRIKKKKKKVGATDKTSGARAP